MEVIPNHWTNSWDDPPSTDRSTFQNRSPWGMAQSCLLFGWLLLVCLSYSNWTINQQTNFGGPSFSTPPCPKKRELKISDDRRRSDHKDYCNLSDPGSLFIFHFSLLLKWDQPKLWWFYLLSRFICALVLPDNWFVSAHLKSQTDRVVCWEIPMKVQDIYYSYHIQLTFCFSHTHRYEQKYTPVCIKYP